MQSRLTKQSVNSKKFGIIIDMIKKASGPQKSRYKGRMKNYPRLNRFIDGFIRALKVAGSSDLFLGIFIILEGLSLMIAPGIFPVLIVLSVLIAFAFAIEWFFDIFRLKRTVWSVLQQICILLIVLALCFFGFLMLFDGHFRFNADRILVCSTTIADGIKNLIHTIKVEKKLLPRIILILLNLVYINYGAVYLFVGGDPTSFYNTTMHGVVFMFCGFTNIWLYCRDPKNKDSRENVKRIYSRSK